MTSLYTTSMSIFATTASGISIPLADGLQLGWQLSLFIWIIPAVIGIIIWSIIVIRKNKQGNRAIRYFEREKTSGIWKVPLAWQVALFMGLQSFIFYVTISWLPEILISYGMDKASAGFMLSYFQFIGIPFSFVVPMLATKMKTQRPLVVTVNLCFIVGIALLLTNQSFPAMVITTTLLGIASSSNFALALTFFSIRAENAKDSAELSGMAQSIGYCVAATVPIIIVFIFDLTNNWTIPLLLLIGITIVIILFGLNDGRNKYVFD